MIVGTGPRDSHSRLSVNSTLPTQQARRTVPRPRELPRVARPAAVATATATATHVALITHVLALLSPRRGNSARLAAQNLQLTSPPPQRGAGRPGSRRDTVPLAGRAERSAPGLVTTQGLLGPPRRASRRDPGARATLTACGSRLDPACLIFCPWLKSY